MSFIVTVIAYRVESIARKAVVICVRDILFRLQTRAGEHPHYKDWWIELRNHFYITTHLQQHTL